LRFLVRLARGTVPTTSEQLAAEVREPRIRISAAPKLSPEQRRPKLKAPEAELDALEEALADAIR
jgi:hypothetical protein